MLDLWKWIYAEDIAEWLSHRPPLNIPEQIDCILSAPHRTFTEKLEGLRELQEEEKEPKALKELEEYLDLGEYLEEQLCCTKRRLHELYETQGGAAEEADFSGAKVGNPMFAGADFGAGGTV